MNAHSIISIAGSMALLLYSQTLTPQSPLELRPPLTPSFPSRSPVITRPGFSAPHDFLACRYVLDELLAQSRYLQYEIKLFRIDADYLWRTWKTNFGVQGGQTVEWLWQVARPTTPLEQMRADRLQSKLFNLKTGAAQLEGNANELAIGLENADKSWWGIRASVAADPNRGEASDSLYSQAIFDLRSTLARLAQRRNTLDAGIAKQQQELDKIQPQLQLRLRQLAPEAPSLPLPWHWKYILSDQPRHSLQEDFDTRYAEALQAARQELTDRKTPAAKR
jgi:hypothetical protein